MSVESDLQIIGDALDEMEKVARRAILQRNKALAALREIAEHEGELSAAWARIVAERCIAEIEGYYDDIPGAGQRTC